MKVHVAPNLNKENDQLIGYALRCAARQGISLRNKKGEDESITTPVQK
jgi:hypothetical protein